MSQSRGHAGLIASRGFEDDERGRKLPEPPKEELEACGVVAYSPALAAGQERNIEVVLGDVDAAEEGACSAHRNTSSGGYQGV